MTYVSRFKQTFTSEELSAMTNEQLMSLVPREWRPFFPGKTIAKQLDWCFYLYDGEAWDMLISDIRSVK